MNHASPHITYCVQLDVGFNGEEDGEEKEEEANRPCAAGGGQTDHCRPRALPLPPFLSAHA